MHSKQSKKRKPPTEGDVVIPTGESVAHYPGFCLPHAPTPLPPPRPGLVIGRNFDLIFNVNKDVQGGGVDVAGGTFDEVEDGGGLQWEDMPTNMFTDEESHLLSKGTLIGQVADVKLIGITPDDLLFDGSPHTARDFSRYVLAMRHTAGK